MQVFQLLSIIVALLVFNFDSLAQDLRASMNWDKVGPEQISFAVQEDENIWIAKQDLLASIDHSINYLKSDKATQDYSQLKDISVDKTDILNSIKEFKQIVLDTSDYNQLAQALEHKFELIRPKSSGVSRPVKFTGYFQPTYNASKQKSELYKYPIYAAPTDFESWPKPHPKRIFLEGYNGGGNAFSPLAGNEIAYLATRWEAFMIHVQGSAILSLEDGKQLAVGFAGATDYPFRGVSKSFLQQHNVAWNKLSEFFVKQPDLLNQLLVKNNRYILFKENAHSSPIGSLGVPVIAERSIATDKRLMPPGALSVVSTKLPYLDINGKVKTKNSMRFVLDQDTGSAIKGAHRVDIFMGSGSTGQKKANAVYSQGEIYYLMLKNRS